MLQLLQFKSLVVGLVIIGCIGMVWEWKKDKVAETFRFRLAEWRMAGDEMASYECSENHRRKDDYQVIQLADVILAILAEKRIGY